MMLNTPFRETSEGSSEQSRVSAIALSSRWRSIVKNYRTFRH